MGVTNLWTILAPVKQHTLLSELKGQTLAVDLSIWVCENQSVRQMQGVVVKPHLRNLFFRVSYLTQLGVKLVFVVEGEAPELKWEEMWKRQQARGLVKPGAAFKGGKRKRSQFTSCLKECCQLLDILGIPHITGKGEAEAMCATLNAAGLVDACITDDGDAFLYGAQTVYRNFTMNAKDPHVESFRMVDIEKVLCITRQSLVGLSLLLGCDYLPGGVSGVGVANAVKLLKSLSGIDIIHRFHEWRNMSVSQCIDKIEVNIRDKAMKVSDFPQQQVIDEFLLVKEKLPSKSFQWKKANISTAQTFALSKLDWPIEYTLEKVLPLVTLWSMLDKKQHGQSTKHIQPHRIVKSRVRHGVPCYQVEWIKEVCDMTTPSDYYTTLEQQVLYTECYPHMVKHFIQQQNQQKSKKKVSVKKSKKDSDLDKMATEMESIKLDEEIETIITTKSDQICSKTTDIRSMVSETLNKVTKVDGISEIAVPNLVLTDIVCVNEATDSKKNVILDNDEDVFIPLSVRIKQRQARNKAKSVSSFSESKFSVIPKTRSKIKSELNPSAPTLLAKISQDVKTNSDNNTHLSVETSGNLVRLQSATAIEERKINESVNKTKTKIHFISDSDDKQFPITPCASIINSSLSLTDKNNMNALTSVHESKTSTKHILESSVVTNSNDDIDKIKTNSSALEFSETKVEQTTTIPNATSDLLKTRSAMGSVSLSQHTKMLRKKKDRTKKSVSTIKKNVLLLDDSCLDTSSTFSENNYRKLNNSCIEKGLPQYSASDICKSEDLKRVCDIDDMINTMLSPSLKDLSLNNQNDICDLTTPSKRDFYFSRNSSPNDDENLCNFGKDQLSMKPIYSAIKNSHGLNKTPLTSDYSQNKTPNSIVFNRTCDMTFGNFNIQTSLLNSLLHVSTVETPDLNISINKLTNNKGISCVTLKSASADEISKETILKSVNDIEPSVNLIQMPTQNSSISEPVPVVLSGISPKPALQNLNLNEQMSPIIPVTETIDVDKVKMLLDFDQTEDVFMCESAFPRNLSSTLNDITNATSNSFSPVPLSLKDRLKLRLKSKSTKSVLQDLSKS